MITKTIFSVRHSKGVYETQTVHGLWAVGVSGYEDTARMLGRKLHPHNDFTLTLDSAQDDVQVFELKLTQQVPA